MAEWLQNMSDEVKTVLDAMPSMVLILDNELRLHDANCKAVSMLGLDGVEFSGMRPGEAVNCIVTRESGLECGTTAACADCVIRRSVEQARHQQAVFRQTGRMQILSDRKKQEVCFYVSASPLVYRRIQAYVVVLEDITELMALRSLIPMCAGCRKIRNEQNVWETADRYLTRNAALEVSHGLCPECMAEYYPDYARGSARGENDCLPERQEGRGKENVHD